MPLSVSAAVYKKVVVFGDIRHLHSCWLVGVTLAPSYKAGYQELYRDKMLELLSLFLATIVIIGCVLVVLGFPNVNF